MFFTWLYMFFMGANLFFAFQGNVLNAVAFVAMVVVFVITGGLNANRR